MGSFRLKKLIRASELLVAKPNTCMVETATTKVQTYKSPNVYQIPVELIKAGRETLLSEILKYINCIWGGGVAE
jgi:hypothetical protein